MDQTPRKKTVLIVDDEPLVLSLVSEIIAEGGYNVLTADNGSKGLQKSREFAGEIDLLLADFNMPGGMSGVELAASMTRERPELKVLLMSGSPSDMLVLDKGWHFLPKPFVASQLRALVAELVSAERKSRFSTAT